MLHLKSMDSENLIDSEKQGYIIFATYEIYSTGTVNRNTEVSERWKVRRLSAKDSLVEVL